MPHRQQNKGLKGLQSSRKSDHGMVLQQEFFLFKAVQVKHTVVKNFAAYK